MADVLIACLFTDFTYKQQNQRGNEFKKTKKKNKGFVSRECRVTVNEQAVAQVMTLSLFWEKKYWTCNVTANVYLKSTLIKVRS